MRSPTEKYLRIFALYVLLTMVFVIVGAARADALSSVTGIETYCSQTLPRDATGAEPAGMYGGNPPAITLRTGLCSAIYLTLAGDYSLGPNKLLRRAYAWNVLAHEYAHARGYDHGEEGVSAYCMSEVYDDRLMLRAGIPRWYTRLLDSQLQWQCS